MPNILANKLNMFVYGGQSPMRLKGALQAGEVSASAIMTQARVKTIYKAQDSGGFQAFNTDSPNFSSLELLEPGIAYAIDARQSFDLGDAIPHFNQTFATNLIQWIKTNKPGATPPGQARAAIQTNDPENFTGRTIKQEWLDKGMTMCYAGGVNKDLISGNTGVFKRTTGTDPTSFQFVPYPAGNPHTRALYSSNMLDRVVIQGGASFVKTYNNFTIVFIGTHHSHNAGGGAYSIFSPSGERQITWDGGLPADANAAPITANLRLNGSTSNEVTFFTEASNYKEQHTATVVRRNGDLISTWIKGIYNKQATSAGLGTFDFSKVSLNWKEDPPVGGTSDPNRYVQSIQFFIVFDGLLGNRDIFELHRNPYVMFEDPYNDGLDGNIDLSRKLLRGYNIGNSVSDALRVNFLRALSAQRKEFYSWGRFMIPGAPLHFIKANSTSGGFVEIPFGYPAEAAANWRWEFITLQPFTQILYATSSQTGEEIGDVEMVKHFYNLFLTNSPNCILYLYSRWPVSTVVYNAAANAAGSFTTSGVTAAGATSVTVSALTQAIPSGARIIFPNRNIVRTTAAAAVGATTLAVTAITYEIPSGTVGSANGSFRTYWSTPLSGDNSNLFDTKAWFERLHQLTVANFPTKTIRLLPVGDCLADLDDKMRAGQIDGIDSVLRLYTNNRDPNDTIHMYQAAAPNGTSGFGEFVLSMIYYATVWKRSPVGLPVTGGYTGTIQAGTVAAPVDIPVSALAIEQIQQSVWDSVRQHPLAGVNL